MVRNLTSAGIRVPDGFATTADAYRRFISDGGLAEMINGELAALDTEDVEQLAAVGQDPLEVIRQSLPTNLESDIRAAYARLAGDSGNSSDDGVSFAVRSSATAAGASLCTRRHGSNKREDHDSFRSHRRRG